MKSAPQETIVLCNGATFPKIEDKKIIRLEYMSYKDFSPNVNISLPDFVRSVNYLPDRIKDLLEIATFVFLADRMVKRGEIDNVEYHAWARSFHFIIKVRDFEFWEKSNARNKLIKALTFMTGDMEYKFTFQSGHPNPPTGLFDREEFKIEQEGNVSIVLFSGGLDSLVGAIERLERTRDKVCLVSHRTRPAIKKTQNQLFNALRKLYPNRVSHYTFDCNLRDTRRIEETQRTRALLYTSIAYALTQAYSQKEFFVYENGVTAINFPRRQDLINARASRTTHPKTIAILGELFSEIEDSQIKIRTPFLWKTKTDVLSMIKEFGKEQLITSTVSCSRTYQKLGVATHCGGCYQCVDRRFAVYGAELDDIDESGIYNHDFVQQKIQDVHAKTTLIDYVRQAKDFAEWNLDHFYLKMIKELVDIVEAMPELNEDDAVEKVWNLCRRHGEQVLKAIIRMRNIYDNPFSRIPEGSFLQMVSEREYLKEPIQRLIEAICKRLKNALPIAFQKNKPKDENDLNDKINSIIISDKEEYAREHPAVSFGLTKVIPDHSFNKYQLLIETKYIRGSTSPSKASESIAADLTKYPAESHILFIIYDPDRSIVDDEKFKRDFEKTGRCTLCVIR